MTEFSIKLPLTYKAPHLNVFQWHEEIQEEALQSVYFLEHDQSLVRQYYLDSVSQIWGQQKRTASAEWERVSHTFQYHLYPATLETRLQTASFLLLTKKFKTVFKRSGKGQMGLQITVYWAKCGDSCLRFQHSEGWEKQVFPSLKLAWST